MTHGEMINGDKIIAYFTEDMPNGPRQSRESFFMSSQFLLT